MVRREEHHSSFEEDGSLKHPSAKSAPPTTFGDEQDMGAMAVALDPKQ